MRRRPVSFRSSTGQAKRGLQLVTETDVVETRSFAALGSAACAVAFDAYYIWAVERESGPRTDAIAGSIAGAAVLLIASVVVRSPGVRAGLLAAAAVIVSAWAIIGSLSIGFFLLPAAVLALMAVLDARHDVPRGVARVVLPTGAACALVVVAIALQLGSSS